MDLNCKRIMFKGIQGECIVPVSSDENMHEFGLYNENGDEIMTSFFCTLEYAREKATIEFPDNDYVVRDLTEEWYIRKAIEYRKRIKRLNPRFRISKLILDMSHMYYSRTPNDWYTYIPFEYNGCWYSYRETAGEEWLNIGMNQKRIRNV